jgi:hypothetical protein
LVPLLIGTLGLALLVAGLLGAAMARPRGVVLSGFLAGVGATWLVLWGRASQACPAVNTPSEGCVAPDLSALVMVPIGLLVIAGVLGLVTGQRGRPQERGGPGE